MGCSDNPPRTPSLTFKGFLARWQTATHRLSAWPRPAGRTKAGPDTLDEERDCSIFTSIRQTIYLRDKDIFCIKDVAAPFELDAPTGRGSRNTGCGSPVLHPLSCPPLQCVCSKPLFRLVAGC